MHSTTMAPASMAGVVNAALVVGGVVGIVALLMLALYLALAVQRRLQARRERQHLPVYIEHTHANRPRSNGAHDGYTWSQ